MKRIASILAAITVLLASSGTMAHAQTAPTYDDDRSNVFVIRVEPGDPAALVAIEPLTAYVGGVLCGTQETTSEGAIIIVGAAGTPDACRTPEALVTLIDRHGNQLFVQPPIALGSGYLLDNLAPLPPGTGAPAPQPAEAGHGVFDSDDSTGLATWLALAAPVLGVLTLGRHLSAPDRYEE